MDDGTESGRAKGGYARAQALTAEQRQEIARNAALSRWDDELPRATHEGDLQLGQAAIPCAVLEDGRRVLTQSGFMRALGRARQAKGRGYYAGDVNLPAFITAKNLAPFISDDLRATSTYIEFRPLKTGYRAFGYPAELLPKVCEVFIDAERAGKLTASQKHIADKAHLIHRGFATVGIIALVDEATGYQADRARDALARILQKFIAKELRKWVKTFPNEFYREMFRLWGWNYSELSTATPRVVGHLTNNLIYDRLAPGVREELHRLTPRNEKGRLKNKLFQRLTDDVGHPRLREHLAAVVALMKASTTKEGFQTAIDRALPRYGENLSLPMEDR